MSKTNRDGNDDITHLFIYKFPDKIRVGSDHTWLIPANVDEANSETSVNGHSKMAAPQQ